MRRKDLVRPLDREELGYLYTQVELTSSRAGFPLGTNDWFCFIHTPVLACLAIIPGKG